MNVFVSEYLTSGALSGQPLPESLFIEGRAMLSAIVEDLLRIPDCQVSTTLDRRLNNDFPIQTALQTRWIESAAEETQAFEELISTTDATLVIAPETDGALAGRVERVRNLSGTSLNCLPDAIRLCGDKLNLFQHFLDHDVPTIATFPKPATFERCRELVGAACVMKPRDGAGSWLTFAMSDCRPTAWREAEHAFRLAGALDRALVQPWIKGRALSVGCLCDDMGAIEILPVAEQQLTDGTFQYLGGCIPADIPSHGIDAIHEVVRAACHCIEGLRGYIGIDILAPDENPGAPLIVEINPRLTTSYVGYRQLCRDNIAQRLLPCASGSRSNPLDWNAGSIEFRPS